MISTSESLAVPRPKRRWLRIGVRGLMALILVLGCGLGYVVHEANVQRAAVVAVERTGGRVRYISISEPGIFDYPRAWTVVEWVGIDDFMSVRAVELMPGADDDDLAKVLRLRKLRFFYDHGANITDAMAARLGELPRLQAVTFGPGSKITDAALAGLARAPRLVQLDLRGIEGPLGDEDLAALAGSTQLESLSLPQAMFTDAGLAHLGRSTSLRDLELHTPAATDAGLAHLAGLTQLVRLDLDISGLTPAGVAHFDGMKALREVTLGRGMSPPVVKAWDRAHPGILVTR